MLTTSFPTKIRFFSVFMSLLLILGFLGSCAKGPNDVVDPGSRTTETTTLYGRITDEAGAGLSGVAVNAGLYTATTDAYGIFFIKDAIVPKGRAVIVAQKKGYYNGARAIEPGTGGVTRMELSMMLSSPIVAVDGAAGGPAVIPGGAKIDFPAGSFVTADGATYTGMVYIAAKYLDPTSPTFYDFFSGDNTGRTIDNKDVSLISCGVLRVKLTDPTGLVEVKLATGKEATITYPKPAIASAPASMPLWYYDETLGMWKEEGSATLTGGVYVGKVSHFSDWNCDYQGPTGTVRLRVLCNGAAIEGVKVRLEQKTAITDNDGRVGFLRVPSDGLVGPLSLQILGTDNDGQYYINTAIPVNLASGQTLELEATLNSPCPAMLYGTLIGCGDEKGEGLVTISYGSWTKYVYARGTFILQAPSGMPITLNVTDAAGNHAKPVKVTPLTSGEQRNMGPVKICGELTTNYIDIPDQNPNQDDSYGLSPDGSLIAIVGKNNSILLYDIATKTKLKEWTISTLSTPVKIQFSADNKRLLFASNYRAAMVYDISVATPTLLCSIPKAMFAALSDDGLNVIAAVYGPPKIALYNAADGSMIKTLTPTNNKDSNGSILAYIGSENSIIYKSKLAADRYTVWDVATDAELRSVNTGVANSQNIGFSDDGTRLYATGDLMTFSVFNTLTGLKMTDIIPGSFGGSANGSALATKNYLFAPGGSAGAITALYFNLSTGALVGSQLIVGLSNFSYVQVSANEKYIAAKIPGGIRIWAL